MADDDFEYPEPPATTPRVTQPDRPAMAGPGGKNPEPYLFTDQSRNDPFMTPALQPKGYLEFIDPKLTVGLRFSYWKTTRRPRGDLIVSTVH